MNFKNLYSLISFFLFFCLGLSIMTAKANATESNNLHSKLLVLRQLVPYLAIQNEVNVDLFRLSKECLRLNPNHQIQVLKWQTDTAQWKQKIITCGRLIGFLWVDSINVFFPKAKIDSALSGVESKIEDDSILFNLVFNQYKLNPNLVVNTQFSQMPQWLLEKMDISVPSL